MHRGPKPGAIYTRTTLAAWKPFGPFSRSNSTTSPSFKVRYPFSWMDEKCTKTSSPVDRWIKPYPLAPLNHFTVPFSLKTVLLSKSQILRIPSALRGTPAEVKRAARARNVKKNGLPGQKPIMRPLAPEPQSSSRESLLRKVTSTYTPSGLSARTRLRYQRAGDIIQELTFLASKFLSGRYWRAAQVFAS